MIDYGIVIPIYVSKEYEPMADKCIESLKIEPSRVLLVDNSPQSYCKKHEGKGFKILYHPENLGVAPAWNLGIKEGHDWTFFVSGSMCFPEGFGAVVDVLEKSGEGSVFFTYQAWHCNAISKKCVERIGLFDENIYPAYAEDSDYMRRFYLAEIPYKGLHDIPAYCQKTSSGVASGATMRSEEIAQYYQKKWNGDPNTAIFKLPFGDKPLDYWPEVKR